MDQLRFDPRYTVARVPEVGTFLLSEDGAAVLGQAVHDAVAGVVDGARTADDIADALSDRFSALDVYHAVETMAKKGYLVSAEARLADDEAAYWSLAGVPTSDAEKRLSEATVSVESLGRWSSEPLRAALTAAGVRLGSTAGAALDVVAATDYLEPALGDLDADHRRRGLPWVIVKPVGTELWVGPLFVPGETGCWHCLAERLEGNRAAEAFLHQRLGGPIESPSGRARLPSVEHLAATLVAQQIVNVLAEVPRPPLHGAVVTIDTRTLSTRRHELTRRPQCQHCGDAGLVARRGSVPPDLQSRLAVGTHLHRAESIDATLERLERHVSPITGAVKTVDRVYADDDGTMHAYTAGHNFAVNYDGLAFLRRSLRVRSGGKGRTESEAKVGAICEAIERYSGVYRGDEPSVRSAFVSAQPEAIHPNDVMLFSERQYRERAVLNEANRHHTFSSQLVPAPFDQDAPIDWTPVWSLIDGTRRLLPTGMCYFNYASFHGYRSAGDLFFLADSNGHAAGTSLEDAALQGLLELIERDAVGIWWYNRIQRPAIDLDRITDGYIEDVRARLDRMQRDIWAIDLTNDVGVTVVCAVSRRRGAAEELVFGFGAHVDPTTAVVRAVAELVQFLASFEKWGDDSDHRYIAFDEAAATWWRTARLDEERYLAPRPGEPLTVDDLADRSDPDLLVELQRCVEQVRAVGSDVYLLDQTRPDLDLPVAKVVAPGLRHMWARLGPGRLYDVPVELGWLDAPVAEDDLNPWAVFF